ncbi:CYFA0S08e00298g1_1 [Cyberlindnera fabianii]|uniref:amidase n=1 Tax=Cyberlindnera fabianii TaxID=36022 RepID=A0A061AW63_CYBFA|nr:CYFA0S08e00298g1_1 [Cyberlindnera fabianii]
MTQSETTSADVFQEKWGPKIEAYRAALAKEVEPYKKYVKGIDYNAEHFNAVEAMESILTEDEKAITNCTAKQLIAKQKSGEYTALDIYEAFAKRGAIAHIFTNCAMELFIEEGRERAKELDKYREEHNGELVGPFHGLPITLKELMKYGGKVTTASYVCYLDNFIEKDPRKESISIQILRKHGAVFYMRTSQPQSVMHLDTDNVITGRTTNPYNRKTSPGGSSGGESAAVALGASVFGIGSDIGGSIRVPAAFCGLYGIRPTCKRVTGLNSLSGGAGQESIFSSQGPFTRHLEDLEYYMEHYINGGKPWIQDPNMIPLEWKKETVDKEAVTFGVLLTDTLVDPSDAIARGLKYVQEKLGTSNIKTKVITIDHGKMKEAFKQTLHIYGQSRPTHEKLFAASGEPLLPLTKVFLNFANPETNDVLVNNILKEEFKLYFHRLFQDEGIDFLISPTSPNVAEVPKNLTHWNYSSMFNLIDFPNIIFKTGLTYDPEVDVKGPTGIIPDFNPADYVNLPINLQLTALRHQDEKLVEGIKILDEVLL